MSNSNKVLKDLSSLSSGTLSKCIYDAVGIDIKESAHIDKIQEELVSFYNEHEAHFPISSNWVDVWSAFKESNEFFNALDMPKYKKSSYMATTLELFKILYTHFYNKNKRSYSEIRNDVIENEYTEDDLLDLTDSVKQLALKVSNNPHDLNSKSILLNNLELVEFLTDGKMLNKNKDLSETVTLAGIKKSPSGLYQVTDSEGHVLPSNPKSSKGRGHSTREAAEKQLKAIEISKHTKKSGREFTPITSQLEDLASAISNLSNFGTAQIYHDLKSLGDKDLLDMWESITITLKKPVINGLTIYNIVDKLLAPDDFIKSPKFIHAFVTYAKQMLDFVSPRYKRIGDALDKAYGGTQKSNLDKFLNHAKQQYIETVRMLNSQDSVLRKRKKSSLTRILTNTSINSVEAKSKLSWAYRNDFNDFISEYYYYHHNAIVDKIKEIDSGNVLYTKFNKLGLDILIDQAYDWVASCLEEAEENGVDLKSSMQYKKVINNLKGLDKRVKDSILKQARMKSASSLKKAVRMSKGNPVKISLDHRNVAHKIQDELKNMDFHSEVFVPSGGGQDKTAKKCTLMFGDSVKHAHIGKALKALLKETDSPSIAKIRSTLKSAQESKATAKKANYEPEEIENIKAAFREIVNGTDDINKIATNLGDLLGDVDSIKVKSAQVIKVARVIKAHYNELLSEGAVDYKNQKKASHGDSDGEDFQSEYAVAQLSFRKIVEEEKRTDDTDKAATRLGELLGDTEYLASDYSEHPDYPKLEALLDKMAKQYDLYIQSGAIDRNSGPW